MKTLKPIILLFLINTFFSHGQELKRQRKLKESERSIYQVFKNIRKTDQQYVVLRRTPDEVIEVMHKANLTIIKMHIDRGFLGKDSLDNYSKKLYSSIGLSIHLTCLHIIKSYPDLFFNEDFISYIEEKIIQGQFDVQLLEGCLSYYYTLSNWKKYHPDSKEYELVRRFDHKNDKLFYEALKRWGKDESTLRHDAIMFIGH